MDDITCPYCEYGFEYQGDGVDNGGYFEEECPECEKSFMVRAEFSVDYYSSKAPCLNGGEHTWDSICGAPKEFFKDKFRCKHCNEERTIKPSPLKEEMPKREMFNKKLARQFWRGIQKKEKELK